MPVQYNFPDRPEYDAPQNSVHDDDESTEGTVDLNEIGPGQDESTIINPKVK